MSPRITLLAAALGLTAAARCPAGTPADPFANDIHPVAARTDDPKTGGDDKKDKKTKEDVAVDQLPAAVVATVVKECPGGKITEAEKVTKKGKTYYAMEVTAGDVKYDVKTALDGTFKSKKVDEDDKDEHDDKK